MVQVVVNSVSVTLVGGTDNEVAGWKVVKVVKEVPDWLMIPDSVTIQPSELAVVQVEVNSVCISLDLVTDANVLTSDEILSVSDSAKVTNAWPADDVVSDCVVSVIESELTDGWEEADALKINDSLGVTNDGSPEATSLEECVSPATDDWDKVAECSLVEGSITM